jgi:Polyketide cyclase / dehydrase and lipid transport
VKATPQEVAEILGDAPSLGRWWPSVYLQVKELAPGDPKTGVGKVIDLCTKGWLPYTLRWKFTVTESNPPHGFSLRAEGDFEGTGVWTIRPDGDYTEADYDWRIAAYKPLLRYGSIVMRPIFAANHRWAMARGQESLELELRRRRGEKVADPPGPTFTRR